MPALPQTIEDRLRRIEEGLKVLAGRANIRPAMDEILSGQVLIGEGGSLRVVSPGGDVVLAVGEYADETYGNFLGRGDGNGVGLYIGPSGAPGGGAGQVVRIYPRQGGTPIVMDDTSVNGMLGRPWLPYPLPVPLVVSAWPATTATSWSTIAKSYGSQQHAHLVVFGEAYGEPGSTGEMRLVVNGVTAGPTVSVPDNGFASLDWSGPVPNGGGWGSLITFEVQCQRLSGGGAIRAVLYMLKGVNSP